MKIGKKTIALALGLPTIPMLAYPNAMRGKDLYQAAKLNNNASGYKRHIARNLRSGNLSFNNLSDQDYQAGLNMYKISGMGIDIAMAIPYGLGIKDFAKQDIAKYSLRKGNMANNSKFKFGRQ